MKSWDEQKQPDGSLKITDETGKFFYIDEEDWQHYKHLPWKIYKAGYVELHTDLHRLVMNYPDGFVDHINTQRNDNRKNNLRICNNSQNQRNVKKPSNNKTGYKGVFFEDGKWCARISNGIKNERLGKFNTKEIAAAVYAFYACKYHKEFASFEEINSDWQERANNVIADGCLTFSKHPKTFVSGSYPTHCYGGYGSTLYTTKGRLTDFVCGLGANLIEINDTFSLPTILEVILAEEIVKMFPVEKVKFLKTGSECCSAAIRYARGYTKKQIIWGYSYHGYLETFISAEKPGTGTIPQQYIKFETLDNLLINLKQLAGENDVAGIILEPVLLDIDVKEKLLQIRNLCTEKNILFIADEVVTGFRTPKYCFMNYFGIVPDLLCLGKAAGNGNAISIIGGKREIMDTVGIFISTTFAGQATPIIEALKIVSNINPERHWEKCENFIRKFNKISPQIQISGIPTRCTWEGDNKLISTFWENMGKRGYLLGRCFFIPYETTKQSNSILKTFLIDSKDIINKIENCQLTLQGLESSPAFKRY
jgi:glutamate-1-semialdehyde 2,1-aminomutase